MKPAMAAALLCAACGGAELRGGRAVATGDEPGGRVVGRFVPTDCRDARGAVAERASHVFVVQQASGDPVLVEVRDGYDSLVVENVFTERHERVFQLVAETEDSQLFLHDFRVPASGEGSGRMAATTRWREVEGPEGHFHAYPEAPVVTCTLAPQPSE